jgi:hypothetical protein
MLRTDLLAETWRGFLRLTPGERRVFIDQLKAWGLKRRTALVAQRGGGTYNYRGPKGFESLTIDAADLEPREIEPRALESLALGEDW